MRVVVTGGCGFIGSHLSLALQKRGYDVVVGALPQESAVLLQAAKVPVLRGSVTDAVHCRELVRGADIVFHLAAIASDWGSLTSFFAVNTQGTRNMLEASVQAGVGRFVLMSSLAVHDFTGYRCGDEQAARDSLLTPYAESKKEAEDIAFDFHHHGKIEIVVVRPGVFPFGPRDRTSFFRLAQALEQGKFVFVDGGRALLGTAYVENLAEGVILAAESTSAVGQVFVLGDPEAVTWKKLIGLICHRLQVALPVTSLPSLVAKPLARMVEQIYRTNLVRSEPVITRYRVGLVSRDFYFSSAKAQRLLGFAPGIDLETGIARTVDWYREEKRTRPM